MQYLENVASEMLNSIELINKRKQFLKIKLGVKTMAKQDPQNILILKKISFNGSLHIKDTVSVKDSTVYQFHNWKYLVKKQTVHNGEDNLLILLDELTCQGWELIKSQPVNLGFYIFKKAVK